MAFILFISVTSGMLSGLGLQSTKYEVRALLRLLWVKIYFTTGLLYYKERFREVIAYKLCTIFCAMIQMYLSLLISQWWWVCNIAPTDLAIRRMGGCRNGRLPTHTKWPPGVHALCLPEWILVSSAGKGLRQVSAVNQWFSFKVLLIVNGEYLSFCVLCNCLWTGKNY